MKQFLYATAVLVAAAGAGFSLTLIARGDWGDRLYGVAVFVGFAAAGVSAFLPIRRECQRLRGGR